MTSGNVPLTHFVLGKVRLLDEFLECFPSVTREVACRALERSESALLDRAAG
jgi:hypothetical protein